MINLLDLNKNKKGQSARNILIAVVTLFSFGFLSIFGLLLYNEIKAVYQASVFWNTDMANAVARFDLVYTIFDGLTVFILALFLAGIAVTSYRLASRPVFFVVTFIIAPFLGLISYFFNHIFLQMVSNSVFSTVVTSFTLTILVATNLHWVALAMIVIGAISLYAKKEKGQFLT